MQDRMAILSPVELYFNATYRNLNYLMHVCTVYIGTMSLLKFMVHDRICERGFQLNENKSYLELCPPLGPK